MTAETGKGASEIALYLDIGPDGAPTEPYKDGEVPTKLFSNVRVGGQMVQIPFALARALGWDSLPGSPTTLTRSVNLSDTHPKGSAAIRHIWTQVAEQASIALRGTSKGPSMTIAQVLAELEQRGVPTDGRAVENYVIGNRVGLH